MTVPDERDKQDALEAAKQKLSEMKGRPFDVDKILATNRAKEERQRNLEKEAEAKLEKVVQEARDRRHTVRERELQTENKRFEEAKLRDTLKNKHQETNKQEEK